MTQHDSTIQHTTTGGSDSNEFVLCTPPYNIEEDTSTMIGKISWIFRLFAYGGASVGVEVERRQRRRSRQIAMAYFNVGAILTKHFKRSFGHKDNLRTKLCLAIRRKRERFVLQIIIDYRERERERS